LIRSEQGREAGEAYIHRIPAGMNTTADGLVPPIWKRTYRKTLHWGKGGPGTGAWTESGRASSVAMAGTPSQFIQLAKILQDF
jgi:hypothetical protein